MDYTTSSQFGSASAGLPFKVLAKRADHKRLLSRLVQRAVADPHELDLGIRVTSAEALCGGEGVLVEGICAMTLP